ncbi:Hypothetical predicted protein [Prunus dulcis]|uniref:Uncharacterized protein n=1 Tax=Prunus dulcis TaxID=3755 RepID=A0A5E4F4R0_PRUDU|nr:Hypothetical predicted protein [Prunus dulcis]
METTEFSDIPKWRSEIRIYLFGKSRFWREKEKECDGGGGGGGGGGTEEQRESNEGEEEEENGGVVVVGVTVREE